MALSRIWAAFIIVSILSAVFLYVSTPDNNDIFNKMVVGKAGDTSRTRLMDSALLQPPIIKALDSLKEVKVGDYKFTRTPDHRIVMYREQVGDGIIVTCKNSVDIALNLIGIMALFMGFLAIAEKAGGIVMLSKLVAPFFSRLFPEVPKNHPALGHMMMNFSANLLNLDNAATPFAIKAMESLQEINTSKDTASNAQIMFLCLHASGLTLIPVSIIAVRASLRAANPTDIFVPCMIVTFVATLAAMLIVSYKQKINIFQPVIIAWIAGISAIIALLIIYLKSLPFLEVQTFSGIVSNGLILLIFLCIVLGALYKKINIFEAFVEGAKGGFETAVRIIPFFVGMLVAISMLRTSGIFEVIIMGMKNGFTALGIDTRFVDGLPTALIRPLSGSGSRGMMIDTMKTYGPDSFAGRLSSILQGCSDTTFYVVALYFGAVSIKNTRYAIGVMLLVDLTALITSIVIAYFFFG